MKKAAFAYIDAHKAEMISLWNDLVMQESFFEDKQDIDKVAERLKLEFEAAGGQVKMHEYEKAGNMLVGQMNSSNANAPIVFMGHMDTVCKKGTIATRPFEIKDGVAYGPGVLDMKGGNVIALYVMKALQAAGYDKRPFKWLLAGDEENAHPHSNAADVFIEQAKGAIVAFNMETGFVNNSIVVGRKGVMRFILEVKGVSAHVGNDPENGRSAILEMAHKIIDVENLTDFEVGTTYNVGTIIGGTVANATPDYCKVVIDIRHKNVSDRENITSALQAIADKTYIQGTQTILTPGTTFAPMETTDGVMQVFELVKSTSMEEGFGEPTPITTGGASDSAYSVIAGVPTLCSMGVKGGRNHSPEEFAVVDTMFERAKLLIACILKL